MSRCLQRMLWSPVRTHGAHAGFGDIYMSVRALIQFAREDNGFLDRLGLRAAPFLRARDRLKEILKRFGCDGSLSLMQLVRQWPLVRSLLLTCTSLAAKTFGGSVPKRSRPNASNIHLLNKSGWGYSSK